MVEAASGAAGRPRFIVAALGITQIISWGSLYYAFSLVIHALASATQASNATTVGAFSVALLAAGVASAPVGAWIDRHGGRWIMAGGSVLGGALLIALPWVHSVAQLYLVWAGLGVAMAATLYDPAFAVLGQLFREHQRRAITTLTLFGGFASTVFWPLTQALIDHHGWQMALMVLGGLNLLVNAPVHAMLLPSRQAPPRDDSPKPPQPARPSGLRGIWRDPAFYGLCASFTVNALVFSAMSVHLLSLLQTQGLSASHAAWVGALIGPMQVLGRSIELVFLSKVHPSRIGVLAMWLLPASLVLLAVAGAQWAPLVLFALLYGCGNGVMTIVRGAIPAELYGREHYGAVNGAMATPVLLAKAAGPLAAAMALWLWPDPRDLLLLLALAGTVSAALFGYTVRRRAVLAAA
ncbi:MFS transporter [Ideonella sp. DXS29W]|uniref:MFS transporter n=1 Tax=Ideonella lacteola TaxID=2984193 RepID=A0ABU9BXW9_9BURK